MTKDFFFQLTIPEALDLLGNHVLKLLEVKAPPPAPEPKEHEKPLTKKQFAEEWNLSLPTVTKRMADGSVPFKRMGRRVYFLRTEVTAVLGQPKKGRV